MWSAYSVLTYNIGGYEVLHEVRHPSPRAEYIYVTDDRSITSSTWNVVYVDDPHPEDPFGICYNIRFKPFDYVHNDIVLRIDGSMGIGGDTDNLIDAFIDGGYDIAVLPHPHRVTAYEEYDTWVRTRKLNRKQADRVLSAISEMGWDVRNDRGLYAFGVMIQRNNEVNNAINARILQLLTDLHEEGKVVERVDQVVGSVVINLFDLKPMMLRQRDVFGRVLVQYTHKSNYQMGVTSNVHEPYYKKAKYPWWM